MLLVAVVTVALGLSYFLKIHSYAYFVVFQIADGLVQSNGLPILIACVASWYGKGRRGLVMGIWYSHTSVGNILGSIIPGIWASGAWGWSFVVPGILMAVFGIVTFFTLVTEPSEVDCREPKQNMTNNYDHYRTKGERQRLLDDSTANSYVEEDNSGRLLHSRHRSINSVDTANMPDIHHNQSPPKVAIRFIDAIKIDSVAIFAFALFFNKLVSYTFIYWLPFYLDDIDINGVRYGSEKSAFLSVFFDLGGIIGSVSAGLIIDKTGCKAIICTVLLLLSVPSLFIYHYFGHISLAVNIVLMMLCGITVYGPSALIITTVSAELGNHPSLKSNQRATATVSSIINGTGGIGAAMGPLLTGYIVPTGWSHVFYMLMASEGASALYFMGHHTSKTNLFFLVIIPFNHKGNKPVKETRSDVALSLYAK
ncbi:uncharacterized protein TRIADDRAFT_60232 [Trichoplax adhaerens]|uniref:Sugar phosphate exchanger 3 n=1 Tax=Trichoplax adhaerens TaxID=10228 RepID=B3S7N3_TRIAD|nr:hypothetical protein TRIADDRAFT_60232 [Trichoplax adhaerens]EDV21320.1 hypothetical protein TRIADDRAFT_60232 [Trichoplax adhaerens]|eukprot:XP_002116287.1 hypothetical protein TRIADDRAFT_60232 [Trichoplax adhaerens]